MKSDDPHPFTRLTPDRIIGCLESATELRCDGRLFALSSFENRVYQVGVEDAAPVVVKFYRPGRWSDAAIEEEHGFCAELVEAEVPVVAPLALPTGGTLGHANGFRFAVYPKRPGRAPELDDDHTLAWLGRFIARIHVVGARAAFAHRPAIDPFSYGDAPLATLLAGDFIPETLREAYATAARHALERVRQRFTEAGDCEKLRLHGDCHGGNILWDD